MRVLLCTIKRSLAKLNIKRRICCNEPTDYKMRDYQDFPRHFCIVVLEGCNSHILGYRMCHF